MTLVRCTDGGSDLNLKEFVSLTENKGEIGVSSFVPDYVLLSSELPTT